MAYRRRGLRGLFRGRRRAVNAWSTISVFLHVPALERAEIEGLQEWM
jgi:hypothetical protein